MGLIIHFILLWSLSFASFVTSLHEDCLRKMLFSSKTPYKLVENLDIEISKPHKSCEALQINMIHRHGNRYPSAKDVRNMVTLSKKINQAVETKVPNLNISLPWKCPFNERQDKILSQVGENELYQLGRRLRLRFPNLFSMPYSPLDYHFVSSCKLRCTHSANALSVGLFENTGTLGACGMQPIAIETNACNNDPRLRFFEICKKYKQHFSENKEALRELTDFLNGPEIKAVIEKVKFKLGMPDLDLTSGDMWALTIACAYSIGMFNGKKNNGVCALFDEEDFQILEYAYDLKHFYKRSAGHKINYESSCPLLKDIVKTLEASVLDSSVAYKGIFRSSHAETIMPLYALLGVYLDDIKPTANNYANLKNRKFRAACISPFSGNLYFVLYRCEEQGFKIQMYINERLTKIPCCQSKIDCDFQVFLSCYEKVVDGCSFEEICELKKNDNKTEL